MILIGCDLHTRKQHVALLNTDTGELLDQELSHAGDAVEGFYAALPPPVTVGIESTGYSLWFHALLQRLGHTLLVGEAAQRSGPWSCARRKRIGAMPSTSDPSSRTIASPSCGFLIR